MVLLLFAACEAPAAPPTKITINAPETPPAAAPSSEPLLYLTELAIDPADKRVGVLLHGYGSNEFDLIPLARELGLKGPIESFVAPQKAGNGHAWFAIERGPDGSRAEPAEVDAALGRLISSLAVLRDLHDGHELVLLGFSQGAMMTMLAAAEHPGAFDRGIALSGALPRPLKPTAVGTRPQLFLGHGDGDRVVSLERGRAAEAALREAGVPLTFREYPGMGHRVDPRVVADVREWLGR